MNSFRRISVCFLAAAMTLLLLAGCAGNEEPAEEPAGETEAVIALVEDEPKPEPSPEPATPASRAAALGMPAPPDIDITSWEFAVANYYNSINEYDIERYGGFEGQGFDARAIDSLTAFVRGARSAGYRMYAAVTYRNFEWCLNHYTSISRELGGAAQAAAADNTVAHGLGVNEHQTGLAVDLTDQFNLSANYGRITNDGFEETEAFDWAYEHCAEYGFIYRYPPDKEDYYVARCIEGHFRYVGVEAATYIMENDLCLEEFLLLYDDEAVFVPWLWEQQGKFD